MKIYCINFQGIAKGQRTNALVQWMFDVFCKLAPETYYFFTSSIDRDYGSNIHGLNSFELLFYKLFNYISEKLKIPYYIRRTVLEKIVDFFLCKRLKRERESFLLITTMYAVRCTEYAKKRGCKVLFFAGNLNDNLYYETVKKEQTRLGLKYTDVFCSDYRIHVYRKMLDNIDYVWCFNSLIAWSFNGKNTILDPRLRKRPTVIYPKEYAKTVPEIITIGYFGHTTLLKGVHLVAEALNYCIYKDKIEFVIAGSVDKHVQSLLTKTNANIKYLGFIPEDKKKSTIQGFDYMIVPSLYDAGPTTINEALNCDVPVIVSNGCGGAEKIIADSQSIIFETMNIKDLAAKLDYAYEHRGEYLRSNYLEDHGCKKTIEIEDYSFFTNIIDNL